MHRMAQQVVGANSAQDSTQIFEEIIPFVEVSANLRKVLPGFNKDWLFSQSLFVKNPR